MKVLLHPWRRKELMMLTVLVYIKLHPRWETQTSPNTSMKTAINEINQFICHRLKEMHNVQDNQRNQILSASGLKKSQRSKGWHLRTLPVGKEAQLFKRSQCHLYRSSGKRAQLSKTLELNPPPTKVFQMVQNKLDSSRCNPMVSLLPGRFRGASCSTVARPLGLHFADLF